MVTYTAHKWPGLENPAYLPDWLPASVQLVHAAGWWESQPSTRQTSYSQHFTGNMDSSAQSERDWAQGGGRARLGSSGSYQIIVDGVEVIITLPFDIAAGHAANSTGNLTSFASEMAIHGGYEAAFQNAAHAAAAVIVAKGWEVDTALLQHWNWLRPDGTQKNCPSIIRGKGDWSRFVATVTRNVAAIRAFLAGGKPSKPALTYAAPIIIPELDAVSNRDGIAPILIDGGGARWFWVGDRVKTRVATGRFQRASRDAARVGPDLKPGEEFDVDWVTDYEGAVWFYTPYGTRIAGADVERISDAKEDLAA